MARQLALRAPIGWTPQQAIAKYFPAMADLYRAVLPEVRSIEARLDRDEARGHDASCLRQALRELRWRLEYTADAGCPGNSREDPRPGCFVDGAERCRRGRRGQ